MMGLVTILLFFLATLVTGIFRPRWLLYYYAASLPFYGIIADIGLQVSPYLVVGMVMGVLMLVRVETIRMPFVVVAFLVYTVSVTITMSTFLPETVNAFPLFRGSLRWLSQIVVLLVLFMPLVFALQFKVGEVTIQRMIGTFLASTAILCLTGIFQMIWFYRTGVDLFPINMFSGTVDDNELRSGMTRISESYKALRMNGLGGGEPKNFGYTCAVAFILNLMTRIFSNDRRYSAFRWWWIYTALFGTGILLSLSTQAYLIVALYMAMLLVAMLVRFGWLSRRTLWLTMLLSVVCMVLWSSNYTRRLIELRIYERLLETGAIEDFNQTISKFLLANPRFIPLGTGLGNVHFWAVDYIPSEFAYYMKESVFVAKAGFLRLISEVGVVGLLAFTALFVWPLYRLRSGFRRNAPLGVFLVLILSIMIFASFMVTADASPFYIFALVLLFSLLKERRRMNEVIPN